MGEWEGGKEREGNGRWSIRENKRGTLYTYM